MPKKVITKVTVYDDGSYDVSRGPDCDSPPLRGRKDTGGPGRGKGKKKSTKKKTASR